MNKSELADAIALDTGMSNTVAQHALASLTRIVQAQLEQGNDVNIAGFGKFKVTERAARTGRNPQTGESIEIKAAKVPKFSAAASLKAAVNGDAKT